MSDTRGPKERAYDEAIAPLVAEIIKVCKEHRINTALQFVLDTPDEDDATALRCTTVLPVDESDAEGFEHINKLRAVMYPQPHFAAFTIYGGGQ